ncbi:hypothetical protein PSTG_18159 [Puccinia striiformis f. sp. tritici PST-78]|uniref:Uncharacterized protein n=1 Tax=Puccinia striiformis f. sp. tritici PST-78 TaxID=1165861 RepID=A0A0L0UN91_9BASI|nr:hypothetical protein PSTG_18159 [Puccinia striiformis f. sp. tritici PST-78]
MSTVMPIEWDPSSIFCTGSGYGPCPAARALGTNRPVQNSTTAKHTNPVVDGGPTNASEPAKRAEPSGQLHIDVDGVLLTDSVLSDDENVKPDPRPNFQNPGSSPFANFPYRDIPTGSGSTGSPFEFPNLRPTRPDTPAEFPPVRAKVIEQYHVEQCRDRVRQIFFEFIRHNSLRNLRGRTRRNRTQAGPTEERWTSTDLLHAVMLEFDAATNMGEHVEMTFI